jgi:16S rRNA (cytosine1402-N4)-methyltransferase
METEKSKYRKKTVHTSVLLKEVIDVLALKPEDYVVDGTLGGGGHAEKILEFLGPNGHYLGIDADEDALERVRERLAGDKRISYAQGNFRDIQKHVIEADFPTVNKIFVDLGLSSDQLDSQSNRGFSFKKDEPLKMTFVKNPPKGTLTAWHVVNEWSEESLADILYGFGGEKKSRKIAKAICEEREKENIKTSKQLADIIEKTISRRKGIHPATRTFQAIRMAVNDELGALQEVLQQSKTLLSKNGRIAIISFHSLEDRIVKHTFQDWEKEGFGKRITKHPLIPERDECKENKRARSAKLRCFEKI